MSGGRQFAVRHCRIRTGDVVVAARARSDLRTTVVRVDFDHLGLCGNQSLFLCTPDKTIAETEVFDRLGTGHSQLPSSSRFQPVRREAEKGRREDTFLWLCFAVCGAILPFFREKCQRETHFLYSQGPNNNTGPNKNTVRNFAWK